MQSIRGWRPYRRTDSRGEVDRPHIVDGFDSDVDYEGCVFQNNRWRRGCARGEWDNWKEEMYGIAIDRYMGCVCLPPMMVSGEISDGSITAHLLRGGQQDRPRGNEALFDNHSRLANVSIGATMTCFSVPNSAYANMDLRSV